MSIEPPQKIIDESRKPLGRVSGINGAPAPLPLAPGVPPGPRVRAVMRVVEAWWIAADFPTARLSIIERLKAVAQGMA